jgi:hypothetical protein
MKAFSKYVEELRQLSKAFRTARPPAERESAAIAAALDGGAARALRRLVDLEDLRSQGAFFTGSELSKRAARLLGKTLSSRSVILDPACGAGDLLLACAEDLPKPKLARARLPRWESQLHGRDLNSAFVEAARLRLALLAARHKIFPDRSSTRNRFPCVTVACGMSDTAAIGAATHIVLNPPFTLRQAPEGCSWASGLVNSAAVFLHSILGAARPGTEIVAILPDVLRSGWRYKAWRKEVQRACHLRHIGLGGQFDPHTDVNVFLLHLKVRRKPGKRTRGSHAWKAPRSAQRSVHEAFEVSVGPVVDYRDPHRGQWQKFIRSKALAPWTELENISTHRRFGGRLLRSPFVAVKRTSRPEDTHRAVGTLVNLDERAAVENHVLVLRPKDGSVKTCRRLLQVLADPQTSARLNKRIRCRHLTVGVLRELPWSDQ